MQSECDCFKVGIKKNGAVMQYSAMPDHLGIAREFLPVNSHIVPAFELRLYSKGGERAKNRLTKETQIQPLRFLRIRDKRIIQIAEVVINRTAAREPPHHADAVCFDIRQVYFRKGILILADDDSPVILPKHEIRPVLRQALKNKFFRSKIEGRIRRSKIQVLEHVVPLP